MRPKMGSWLDRALAGEDVGVTWRGKIIALRPVEVYSEDYAQMDYGMTGKQLDGVVKKLNRQAGKAKRKVWDGTVKGLRG